MDAGAWHVLVVEDDEEARQVLTALLTQAGYEVDEARDGIEAVRQLDLNRGRYAAVITDYQMSRMDGLQLLTLVRFVWPEVPVVLVSGADVERLAAQQGAYAWMRKPYDSARLLQIVRAAVQWTPAEQMNRVPSRVS